MNPIKNKKDLETTINEIRKFAYTYLEKYSPSKQQLRIYLLKKFLKKNQKIFNKKELFTLIDVVISTLVEQKVIYLFHLELHRALYWLLHKLGSGLQKLR